MLEIEVFGSKYRVVYYKNSYTCVGKILAICDSMEDAEEFRDNWVG